MNSRTRRRTAAHGEGTAIVWLYAAPRNRRGLGLPADARSRMPRLAALAEGIGPVTKDQRSDLAPLESSGTRCPGPMISFGPAEPTRRRAE